MRFLFDMRERPLGVYPSGRAMYSIHRIDNDQLKEGVDARGLPRVCDLPVHRVQEPGVLSRRERECLGSSIRSLGGAGMRGNHWAS